MSTSPAPTTPAAPGSHSATGAGARVPTGRENVRVTYRKGIGVEGLVREQQLTLLGSRPLGVVGVTNPVEAGDAADADNPDDLRRNAPLPIHTLDRIVSLRDYEDFARAFTGVAKARRRGRGTATSAGCS